MPAIASLEDLKSARKEGLSIYAMLYLSSKAETTATEDALCSMLYGNGGRLAGKTYANSGSRNGPQNS
jgi:hypothetical protein